MFDLKEHGFPNCVLSDDMHDLSDNLPHWENIPRVSQKTIGSIPWEHLKQPLFDSSGAAFVPAFEWGDKIDEGTYGKIYLAKRKLYRSLGTDISGRHNFGSSSDNFEHIVIKESPIHLTPEELKMPYASRLRIIEEEIQTLIHEAAVLTLAYIALKKAGLDHMVPKVYEIFCHSKPMPLLITDISSICISMEYIHGNTLLKYMRANFKKETKIRNDTLFLEFVMQMATILSVLQKSLRMNHRDIKINNILLRDKSIDNPHIVLIDYGFACIANGVQEPRAEMSKIEAGAFFGSRYACFKHGRDMCQFLYSLHCYFPFETFLTHRLLELVKTWMCVPYKYGVANLLKGITLNGYPFDVRPDPIVFDEGIYHFLRRPEVDPLQCSPTRIMDDIAEYKRVLRLDGSKIEHSPGIRPIY